MCHPFCSDLDGGGSESSTNVRRIAPFKSLTIARCTPSFPRAQLLSAVVATAIIFHLSGGAAGQVETKQHAEEAAASSDALSGEEGKAAEGEVANTDEMPDHNNGEKGHAGEEKEGGMSSEALPEHEGARPVLSTRARRGGGHGRELAGRAATFGLSERGFRTTFISKRVLKSIALSMPCRCRASQEAEAVGQGGEQTGPGGDEEGQSGTEGCEGHEGGEGGEWDGQLPWHDGIRALLIIPIQRPRVEHRGGLARRNHTRLCVPPGIRTRGADSGDVVQESSPTWPPPSPKAAP